MNRKKTDLYLHQQMLLLILRDREGTVESRAGMYRIALGGAIFCELMLQGRIEIEEGKKAWVSVADQTPMSDPLLDEALEMISTKRRRQASAWINSLAGMKRLRHRIAEGLCRQHILKDSQDTVLLIFKRKIYPTIDPLPERALLKDIKAAINSTTSQVDARTGLLISLANATGTLRAHFDKRELKRRARRIEQIAEGQLLSGAAKAAVQAAQAAAVIAVTAATTATT